MKIKIKVSFLWCPPTGWEWLGPLGTVPWALMVDPALAMTNHNLELNNAWYPKMNIQFIELCVLCYVLPGFS